MRKASIVGPVPDEDAMHMRHFFLGLFDGHAAIYVFIMFVSVCGILWACCRLRRDSQRRAALCPPSNNNKKKKTF